MAESPTWSMGLGSAWVWEVHGSRKPRMSKSQQTAQPQLWRVAERSGADSVCRQECVCACNLTLSVTLLFSRRLVMRILNT